MLRLKLKGLENKDEIIEQVKTALNEAIGELGATLDDDARESIAKALRSLGDLDFDKIMESHQDARRGHRDQARERGDREKSHARARMLKQRRAHRDGAHTPPPPPSARAPRERSHMAPPPPAPRNHDLEARFNRLEERMKRIERMLESLTKQG